MTGAILDLAHQTMTSPWLYLVLFALAALDGFFPLVPGETLIISASVFAASGGPHLLLVIVVAILGAFAGDHTSYLIGRTAGGRLERRARPGTRRRAAFDWARRVLGERGGMVIVASRFVPGVRTAATMTPGVVGYPLRSFSLFDSVAASLWAAGWALMGYLGGASFENEPIKGLLFGLGFAMMITVLVEVVRYIRRRSRRSARAAQDPPMKRLPYDTPESGHVDGSECRCES